MNQLSIFDAIEGPSALVATKVAPPPASKAQRRFRSLVAQIESQREFLRQWQDFLPSYLKRHHAELEPLHAEWRLKQRAMAALLDVAMDGKALGKTLRYKAKVVLMDILDDLLAQVEDPDAELVRLFDKYSECPYREQLAAQAEAHGDGASDAEEEEAFSIDPESTAHEPAPAQPETKKRRLGAQAKARQALRDEAAQSANRVLRDVYRKLVSELHPDRESDQALHAQKTLLMQKANQAYAANDLLSLLELQLQTAQIDPRHLEDLAAERLALYNRLLEQQLKGLQVEVSQTVGPYVAMVDSRKPELLPVLLTTALEMDIAQAKFRLGEIEAALRDFRDIKRLKAFLKKQDLSEYDDLDFEEFAFLDR